MITIIDLNSGETEHLVELLKNLGESFRITTDETKVIHSERVIICTSADIPGTIRNLHLLNLYSVLRLCRRPLLGIGSGMHLMGGNFKSGTGSGLGIFPTEVYSFGDSAASEYGLHKVNIIKPGLLLDGVEDGKEFYMLNSNYFSVNDLSTAESEINNTRFTAAIETTNYFGVQFCPGRSGPQGQKVIENFISIKI